MKNDFEKNVLIGLTAKHGNGWKRNLDDIEKHGINRIALFLEEIKTPGRRKLYPLLLKSGIKEIPLVHIRAGVKKKEIEFFIRKYKTKYFTIHPAHFRMLDEWDGFHNMLYVEPAYEDSLLKSPDTDVSRIGGFCIDLSHFKASEQRRSSEYDYVIKRANVKKYFKCNHLNGYSWSRKKDLHTVRSIRDFDYLKTLPKFPFGEIIALEIYNSIKEQIEYKKYLVKMLKEILN